MRRGTPVAAPEPEPFNLWDQGLAIFIGSILLIGLALVGWSVVVNFLAEQAK